MIPIEKVPGLYMQKNILSPETEQNIVEWLDKREGHMTFLDLLNILGINMVIRCPT
jgi:hypothetical protein